MFAIHRTDPRKTPDEALQAIGVLASCFVAYDPPPEPRSAEWALRLYDFAQLCFEVRENLAGQRLTYGQGARAFDTLARVLPCFLLHFRDLAPFERLADACDALKNLVIWAVEGTPNGGGDSMTLAHVDAQWLQNLAHGAYLDHRRREILEPPRRRGHLRIVGPGK